MADVFMSVPLPEGNNERVSLVPFEASLAHRRASAPFENMKKPRAGVTVALGFLFRSKKLNLA